MIMQIVSSQFAQAVFLAVFSVVVTQLLSAKGKLRWSVRHAHWYRLPAANSDGSDLSVVTQELWFNNTGRAVVENVEIVLNWKPQHYELWTPRDFSQQVLPDGRLIIRVPSLAAKEWFSLSLIDTKQLPTIVNVRSRNGEAGEILMLPTRVFSQTINIVAAVMMLTGLATIIYALISVGKIVSNFF
ncbi:hypothetical protein [Agrobacterium cavarae]|uniref:hypothetical protein n=1 Tax=Agrobacterium cavarae TaxID=2528239 RepID=UPI000DDF4E6F|nr:hypothetical protein [Agrobacterium cavarae]